MIFVVVFKSKQEAVDAIKRWLKEEEYEVSLVPDESTDYNCSYFDGLTKQSFFDSLVGIFHCLRLIVAKFDILGRTGPLQDDSSV